MRCRADARLACAVLLTWCAATFAAPDDPAIPPFSSMPPGDALAGGWTRTDIKGVAQRTRYTLVDDEGKTVLRADSRDAASALVYRFDPAVPAHVLLRWRWKVSNVLASSDPTTKRGDDFAARVYVMFDFPLSRLSFAERLKLKLARAFYDPEVPAAALCYVWDTRLPAGTILASPYTSRVRVVVVTSGESEVGRWLTAERDVAADFRRAFGEEPPAISAVAVATDTDNTHDGARAWYGDIVLKKRTVTTTDAACGPIQDCFLAPLKQK